MIKKSGLNTAWLLIKKCKRANLVFSWGYMNKVGDVVKVVLSLDTKNNSKVLGLSGLVVLH